MYNDVRAESQWLLQGRRCECVVNAKQTAVLLCNFSNDFDIGNPKRRIGWRFNPDQFSVWSDVPVNFFCLGCVDVVHGDSEFAVDVSEESECSSVDVINRENLVSAAEKFEYRIDSGQSACECGAGGSMFEFCDQVFQRRPGGITRAGIVVTFVYTRCLLHECGCLVNWNRYS